MQQDFYLFNTLSRKKERFEPINPPHVGLYVCGPTVYGEPHLGHIRMAITFDILYRYLQNIEYKVRYVRNITDVGHLENEMEESGEDKIEKKARLESIEPMEVAQKYKNLFQEAFNKLNLLSPSIEPLASGHIIEQKEMIDKIIKNGFAYVVKESGSIYFDIKKYNEKYQYNNELRYGALSGRKIEDMLENTRKLAGQSEKKNPLDFALWKEALPNHIMRWKNLFTWKEKEKRKQKTSIGFPGWHLECSAMGTKYLGETFDIHGGGMDLMFPHHECEIAQSVAANGKSHVKYWMHNNMITIDGQKMAKSLNNFITLNELFTGNHKKLEKAYSPMAIRFFVLQAHYRSTLDFSNEALKAAEKGMKRLFEAIDLVPGLPVSKSCSFNLEETEKKCYKALNDDLNTPIAIAHLFELAKFINLVKDGKETIDNQGIESLKKLFRIFVQEIMGLLPETQQKAGNKNMDDLVNLLLNMRLEAKAKKDFETADKIRDELTALGIEIKDKKDGFEWSFK